MICRIQATIECADPIRIRIRNTGCEIPIEFLFIQKQLKRPNQNFDISMQQFRVCSSGLPVLVTRFHTNVNNLP
jgi:hypothetical protein